MPFRSRLCGFETGWPLAVRMSMSNLSSTYWPLELSDSAHPIAEGSAAIVERSNTAPNARLFVSFRIVLAPVQSVT